MESKNNSRNPLWFLKNLRKQLWNLQITLETHCGFFKNLRKQLWNLKITLETHWFFFKFKKTNVECKINSRNPLWFLKNLRNQ